MDWIERTVHAPSWAEQDQRDATIERRFRAIDEFDGRILRVACVETATTARVVSMMFDRNARRKL
jgi:hypothetical protein